MECKDHHDLTTNSEKCNFFSEANTDYDENSMESSDLILIDTLSASNITECCDVCFQNDSCTLFRFLKLANQCEYFAPKSNSYQFKIFGNDCYDLGFVTGK